MDSWNILKLLEWSTQYFQNKGIESPRLEAELLLAHSLSLSRIQLYMQFDRLLQETELQNFKLLLKRRSEREPLAYILGKKEFYSMEFEVTPAVLIPRPETELLVEKAIQHFSPSPFDKLRAGSLTILDIGTGSACIAITLAKHLPGAQITAIDISGTALEVARRNAQKHGVETQIQFMKTDFLSLHETFDFMVSNPPYVATNEIIKLAPELQFEPKSALDGGKEGLDCYKALLPWTFQHLSAQGIALFEMGFDQAESLQKLATNTGFQKISVLKDYAGHSRLLVLSK